jgi:hypothetical protein
MPGSWVALIAGAALSLSSRRSAGGPFAILMPAALMWFWDGATPRRAAVLDSGSTSATFSVGT